MMKIKQLLLIALIITAIIMYFSWDTIYGIRLNVQELSDAYKEDAKTADNKYLNKNLFIEGKVKAFYRIMGTRPVLELELSGNSTPVFFFPVTRETESMADGLQQGQKITAKGKCLGKDAYSFIKGVKIDVEKIEE
jgi:hypothetical protein